MAEIEVQAAERSFSFRGMVLPDPVPGATPEKVKEHYAGTYPELTNASIEGPQPVGGKLQYTFVTAVGSKG